jgi:hypothetical protein
MKKERFMSVCVLPFRSVPMTGTDALGLAAGVFL